MPHLTMAGLALIGGVGAMLGAYLGKDAIDQIDPIFFSPLPETHFFADDVPQGYRLGDPDPVPREHLWWNAVPSGPCLNCTDNFVEPLYASATTGEPRWDQAMPAEQPIQAERPIVQPAIERYTSFPITEEEARLPARSTVEYAERVPAEEHAEDGGTDPLGM